MALGIKYEPGKLNVEAIRPLEGEWWRTTPISEPEQPRRWVWAIVGVTVLFGVVAGGGYYWFAKPRQVSAALQVAPPPNATAKAAGTEPAANHPTPQLTVGLPPLNSQQPDELATAPASAQSPPPTPDEPPKFASGLRPITAPAAPQPAAEEEAAPVEPPHALPQRRPVRRAAPPSAAPGAPPSAPSGSIKF